MPNNNMALTAALLLSLSLIATCSAAVTSQAGAAQGIAPLLQDVFAFWLKHGLDQQYGESLCLKCYCLAPSHISCTHVITATLVGHVLLLLLLRPQVAFTAPLTDKETP